MSDQPPVVKVRALSRVVQSFYSDHLAKYAGRECACDAEDPDPNCDRGIALWKLTISETVRVSLKL
jgi:hypothetical protein